MPILVIEFKVWYKGTVYSGSSIHVLTGCSCKKGDKFSIFHKDRILSLKSFNTLIYSWKWLHPNIFHTLCEDLLSYVSHLEELFNVAIKCVNLHMTPAPKCVCVFYYDFFFQFWCKYYFQLFSQGIVYFPFQCLVISSHFLCFFISCSSAISLLIHCAWLPHPCSWISLHIHLYDFMLILLASNSISLHVNPLC